MAPLTPSPQAYLQQEQTSPIKHEYRNGFAYAMAGTTDRHNTIVGNLYSLLRQHLRGTPCSVYFADIYELHGFQTDAVYKLAIGLDF